MAESGGGPACGGKIRPEWPIPTTGESCGATALWVVVADIGDGRVVQAGDVTSERPIPATGGGRRRRSETDVSPRMKPATNDE